MHRTTRIWALVAFGSVAAALGAAAALAHFSSWGPATLVDPVDAVGVNSTASDGCPIESPNGRSLYVASTRAGGAGLLDLWVAQRDRKGKPWGDPVNLNDAPGQT